MYVISLSSRNSHPQRNELSSDGLELFSRLFEWNDGPLIKAMASGDFFLADEISLADDSVLERLNSLLEAEKTIFLAEKGLFLSCVHLFPEVSTCEFFYLKNIPYENHCFRRGRVFHSSGRLLVRRDHESRWRFRQKRVITRTQKSIH